MLTLTFGALSDASCLWASVESAHVPQAINSFLMMGRIRVYPKKSIGAERFCRMMNADDERRR
jgi:hypothetical protein